MLQTWNEYTLQSCFFSWGQIMFCMPVLAFHCTSSGISAPVWTRYFFCLHDYSACNPSQPSFQSMWIHFTERQGIDLNFIFKYFNLMCNGKNWKDDYWLFLYYSVSAFSSCSLNASMINNFSAVLSVMHSEALGCLICPIFPQCLNVPCGSGVSRH